MPEPTADGKHVRQHHADGTNTWEIADAATADEPTADGKHVRQHHADGTNTWEIADAATADEPTADGKHVRQHHADGTNTWEIADVEGLPKQGILTANAVPNGEGIYTIEQLATTLPAATGSQQRYLLLNNQAPGGGGATTTNTVNFTATTITSGDASVMGWTTAGTVGAFGPIRTATQAAEIDVVIHNSAAPTFVKIYDATSTEISTDTIQVNTTTTYTIPAGGFMERSAVNGVGWNASVSVPAVATNPTAT
ncbi:MAG: hypothetical protein KAH03_06220, partial [Cocleimonas sp.]|nr:hypothetical protein [Cocleimonas sp.]